MSDFSVHIAEQIRDLMSQGTVRAPPTTVYVAVFDDTDTERSTDFQNDRVGLAAGAERRRDAVDPGRRADRLRDDQSLRERHARRDT